MRIHKEKFEAKNSSRKICFNIRAESTRADFVIQYHQSLSFTPQFKEISECRQKKFSQAEIQNKRSRKVALKPVRQTLVCWGEWKVLRKGVCLQRKKMGKSDVLSRGFCLFDSGAEE